MPKDPSLPIRTKASRYPGVDQGTACAQSSYKVGTKSFLFIGMQGGRHKAMFKLDASIPEAKKLAAKAPDDFGVGSNGWVTARFSEDAPLPKKVWEKWLDESYAISAAGGAKKKSAKKKAAKKSSKKVAKKKTTKKTVKKAATKKKATKKKMTRKKTTRKKGTRA